VAFSINSKHLISSKHLVINRKHLAIYQPLVLTAKLS
jgi:hypothetical protein